MPAAPFHLAWFLQGSSIQAWGEPWTGNISDDWMSCDMFLDLARGCERACMDYMLLEDSIYVGETWQNSRDIYLKNGMSIPRQEPTVVATLMAAATTAARHRADAVDLRLCALSAWPASSARWTRSRAGAPAGTW